MYINYTEIPNIIENLREQQVYLHQLGSRDIQYRCTGFLRDPLQLRMGSREISGVAWSVDVIFLRIRDIGATVQSELPVMHTV